MQKHYLVLHIQELINVNVANLYIQAELLQIWKSSRTWTLLDHDKHYIVVVPVLELLTKLKIGKHRGEEIKFQRFYMVIHVSCLEEARWEACATITMIFFYSCDDHFTLILLKECVHRHMQKIRYVFHTNCIFYVFLKSALIHRICLS